MEPTYIKGYCEASELINRVALDDKFSTNIQELLPLNDSLLFYRKNQSTKIKRKNMCPIK
jgi:hypothetical protein